jgi:hypothetical protein
MPKTNILVSLAVIFAPDTTIMHGQTLTSVVVGSGLAVVPFTETCLVLDSNGIQNNLHPIAASSCRFQIRQQYTLTSSTPFVVSTQVTSPTTYSYEAQFKSNSGALWTICQGTFIA